jgi:hypothetical protein
VLAYYDLRAMTLSLIMGVSIVAATLLCHWADSAQPVHPTWDGRAEAASYPSNDLVGSEALPSLEEPEVIRLHVPEER